MDALQIREIAQEERNEHQERMRAVERRLLNDRSNPLEEYNDSQFVQRFRLSKESFHELLELIGPDLQRRRRRSNSLNTIEQLGIALRFYASGSFQLVVGNTCGVSQSSCCRVIHDVTSVICERKRRFIRFPASIDER